MLLIKRLKQLNSYQLPTTNHQLLTILFLISFLLLDIFPHAITFYPLLALKLLLILLASQYLFSSNTYLIPTLFLFLTFIIHPPQTPAMFVAAINLSTLLAVFVLSHHHKINLNNLAYLLPLATIGLISPIANPNVTAMNIYALFFMKAQKKWGWYALTVFLLILSNSEGASLAFVTAIFTYTSGFFASWVLLIGFLLAVIAVKIYTPATLMVRFYLWASAWFGFVQSPLIGHGWGNYEIFYKALRYVQPHNLILDLAYSGGLLWLIAFALALTWLYQHKNALKPYKAFFIALFVHSLVDAPYGGLPGILFALILGQALPKKLLAKESLVICH